MKNGKKYLIKPKNDIHDEKNMSLRDKNLSFINTRINRSIINLNNLISKMNNLKDIVLFNQCDQKDLKSIRNLDSSALYFSKHIRNELNASSELLKAYGLSNMELDDFISRFQKKTKRCLSTAELAKKFKESKTKKNDEFEKIKEEFNLGASNNIEESNMNNKFLSEEKQSRDLYDLNMRVFLDDQRNKIGKKEKFESVDKKVDFLREAEKINYQNRWSQVKSKYYNKYKLSRTYQDEQEIILNQKCKEEKNINEFDENKKSKNLKLISSNNNNKYKSRNELINNNIHSPIIMKNNLNTYKKLCQKKPKSAFNRSNISTINKCSKNFITFSDNNKNNNSVEIFKKLNKNTINNSKINSSKTNSTKKYFKGRRSKNSTNLTSKITFHSSRASSRPISAFSSCNNTTFYKLNNNSKIYKFPKKYINEINNIIKISKLNTKKFKEESKEMKLENKRLFKKSYSDVFAKTSNLNLDNIIKEFNFNYNKEDFRNGYEIKPDTINKKNNILNNADKVKKLLNAKGKKILDEVLKKLLVIENKIEHNLNFSYNEKLINMREENKKFKKIAKDTMKFENELDKQRVFDMFSHEDAQIFEWADEIKILTKLNEEDWKNVMQKQNILKEIQRNKIRRNKIDMNFIKKQTINLLKRKNRKSKV